MNRHTSTVVWGLVAVVSVSYGLVAATVVARPHQNSNLLPQAASWIPFEADVLLTRDGGERIVGHYSRAADGSSRRDLKGTTGESITIYNIAHRKYYSYRSDRGWQSQPMDIPDDGIRPRPVPAASHHLLAEKREGLVVWQENTAAGDVMLKAQELNFFPIEVRRKLARRTEVYSNIRLRVPDDGLFVPPPNVEVLQVTTPGGLMVRYPQR